MTVTFNLREMTVAELETLLALLDPLNQAHAYRQIEIRLRNIKCAELDTENE